MKTAVISLVAVLVLGTSALAQRPGGGQGGPGGGGQGGPGGGGGRQGGGMRMFEQLGLTEAQKTKMKTLTDKQREESAALRKKHTEQINALLTPEQRKKLEEARKQMMDRFRSMGGPGGGAPGGAGKPSTGAAKPGSKKG